MGGSDNRRLRALLSGLAVLMLASCGSLQHHDDRIDAEPFEVKDLAKTDVDIVTEIHLRHTLGYLRAMMEKLYRRNPREWRNAGHPSLQAAVKSVFAEPIVWRFPEISEGEALNRMRSAFDEDFAGDRVMALITGLGGMILKSYNGKQEFYLLDELDPQKLYNAARNIEVAVWKLSHDRDTGGRPFLLSNEMNDSIQNLSFERLFGKMIALQDNMAEIVADATNRRIRYIIRTLASAVFIPL